jgi:hypothetical protein
MLPSPESVAETPTDTATPPEPDRVIAVPESDIIPTSTPTVSQSVLPGAQALPGDVVINEVAWAGTLADASDQWIELFNPTSSPVLLENWQIVAADGMPIIPLAGIIAPGGYYLLECNDDATVNDVPADAIYLGGMSPSGETLYLLDASGRRIDSANADGGDWPAGQRMPPGSMERIAAVLADTDAAWATNNPLIRNGTDSGGQPIRGTPRQPNSTTYPALPGEVVINEVAWSGSAANGADEWIELVNTTQRPINLSGWRLLAADGSPSIPLAGFIQAGDYYLIERDHDQGVSDVMADLVVSFSGDLSDAGETLYLMIGDLRIDTVNADGGAWPAGEAAPRHRTMERISPLTADRDDGWVSNDTVHRNGLDAAGNPLNGTPRAANSSTRPPHLLISEVLYDGITSGTDGDEFVELCNAQPDTVTLRGIKVGDAQRAGSSESMFLLPDGLTLAADGCLIIAKNAAQYAERFGSLPNFEVVAGQPGFPDTPEVPQLEVYSGWAGSRWALADDGDEVIVLDAADQIIDSIAFAGGDYAAVGLSPDAVHAGQPNSLQRLWPQDTDSMPDDFVRRSPSPGGVTRLPAPPAEPPPAPPMAPGMYAYWGVLNSHSSYSDGAGPPALSFATARAQGVHFLAVTDSSAVLRQRSWTRCIDQAAQATQAGQFVGLCGFEYRDATPGFLTVWNTTELVSNRDTAFDTLPEVFAWLHNHPEAVSGWYRPFSISPLRDLPADRGAPPVHLWQTLGGAATGGVDPLETAWMQVLARGWRVAPLVMATTSGGAGDDATAAPLRTGIVAPSLSYADVVDALRARRVFATQDAGLALALRTETTWMGSQISPQSEEMVFTITMADIDTEPEPVILTLFDRSLPLVSRDCREASVEWKVRVKGQPGHYYWVRALQADGDVAETAPLWIEGISQTSGVFINEILPAPHAVDWNGDGLIDHGDEWVELYNSDALPVGIGGWEISDNSGKVGLIPLLTTIPAHGFTVLGGNQLPLRLNNTADRLVLVQDSGNIGDSYAYDRGPGYDLSLCRLPDGMATWQRRCQPTPGSANQALPEAQPLRTDVRGARNLPVGSWVEVRGRITVPPGIFSARVAYLQDDGAGLRLYLPDDHRMWCQPGERVSIVGRTSSYYGELQLRVAHRQDVQRRGEEAAPPPLPIATGQMGEPYEGMLVLLNGTVVEMESGGSFWVDDGSGPARVYPDPDAPLSRPHLTSGETVQVVGVVSQRRTDDGVRNGGYRLLPRYDSDVVAAATPVPMLVPLRLPETGGRPD